TYTKRGTGAPGSHPPISRGWQARIAVLSVGRWDLGMAHIEIRDVSLVYDTPAGQVTGVDRASFSIEQSEFLCIVGPSGCGKSTLLNIIAGFLKPTGGQITIAGQAVSGSGMDRGVVFQDFAQLFPWRTALGNVAFGLEMKGIGKAEREAI